MRDRGRTKGVAGPRGSALGRVRALLFGVAIGGLAASASAFEDRRELEGFIDGVVTAQRVPGDIAGAVVTVVRGDEVVLSKGYGLADVETGRWVDPEDTLFRPGSVSKLFTWTAVMQLVEEGLVDLDTDVNAYLDGIEVPATFDEPITLAHLMTHTPGFEDRVVGLFSNDPAQMRPLREILAEQMPLRVRPPGRLAAYSNHGTAIAGLIVEQVSGVRFEEYVRERILAPLGMHSSTFVQPLPEELAARMSGGYTHEAGRFVRGPFELVPASPAGGMSATAADMARFMIAHLQDGQLGDARILERATARRMREQLHSHDGRVNGMAHGFIELHMHGENVVGHLGDTMYFHSILALFPERQVGVFASYNTLEAGPAALRLYLALLEHYFPVPDAPLLAIAGTDERIDRIVGFYRATRVPHTTLAKVMQLGFTLPVVRSAHGGLLVADPVFGQRAFSEIAPWEFREDEGQGRVVFQTDSDGNVERLLVSNLPIFSFERVTGEPSPNAQLSFAIGCLALLASCVVAWPVGALRRRSRGEAPGSARAGRAVGGVVALGFVGFVAALGVGLRDPVRIVFGVPTALQVALAMALVSAVLSPVLLVFAWRIGRDPGEAVWSRTYYVGVAAAAVGLAAWLHHWNLVGFRY